MVVKFGYSCNQLIVINIQTLGWSGFYIGWFPALVQKIPSYALTWMFFQQLKAVRNTICYSLKIRLLYIAP